MKRIVGLSLAACWLLLPSWSAAADGDVRVQLSAVRQTTLSSGIAAKITDIRVREGESFRQGDTLLTFDCAVLREKFNYSVAAENAARKKLAIANRLDKLNSISLSTWIRPARRCRWRRRKAASTRPCCSVAP